MGQLVEFNPAQSSAESDTFFLRNPAAWLREKKLSRGFWVFFTAAFFFDFGFSVYFFLFNLYLLDIHFNERAIGLVGGAMTLGSAVATLPAGLLARRIGVRTPLIVCFIAAPVLGVLRALAMSEPLQIGLGFAAGLAMCLWGVCYLPALARLTTEDNRAFAFSLIFSASIGTSTLGGVVCGYLPQWLNNAGFAMQPVEVKRLILLVSSAIAAIGLFAVLRTRLPQPRSEPQPQRRLGIRRWRLDPFLLRFLVSMALWTAVLASFTPFANVYLSRELHVPLSRIGLIFSAAQILQFCVVLLTPMVFRALGLINGIVATQIMTALAIGCLAETHNMRLAVPLYMAFSAMQWMSSPGLYNLLMSGVRDEDRSIASSMTMFCNAVLQSGATALAGILFVRFGYPHVMVGIAVLAALAAGVFRTIVGPVARPIAGQAEAA